MSMRYRPGARAIFINTNVVAQAITDSLQGLEGKLADI